MTKEDQALALAAEAERLLKPKGWLFPKADKEGAVTCYQKAGNAYKAVQKKKEGAAMFGKAVDVYATMDGDNFYKMATLCETAALLLKDGVDGKGAIGYYDKAAFYYRQNGMNDGAREALGKAALVQGVQSSLTESMCHKLINLASDDEAYDAALSPAQILVNLYAGAKDLPKAVKASEQQISLKEKAGRMSGLYKDVVGLCLFQLGLGDYVAAELAQRECMRLQGFLESDECGLIDRILQTFDEGDADGFAAALESHVARTLPREVYAFGRSLKVRSGKPKTKPAATLDASSPHVTGGGNADGAEESDGVESDNSDL